MDVQGSSDWGQQPWGGAALSDDHVIIVCSSFSLRSEGQLFFTPT